MDDARIAIVPSARGRGDERRVAELTRSLSRMLDAGLPLVQSLAVQADELRHTPLGRPLVGIHAAVASGTSFGEAVSRWRPLFGDLYVETVTAGGRPADLPATLRRLAGSLDSSRRLDAALLRGLLLPAALLAAAAWAGWLVMAVYVPAFEEGRVGPGWGRYLPYPARITFALSHLIVDVGPPLLVLTVLAAWRLRSSWRRPGGKRVLEAIALRLPLTGTLLRKVGTARFCRAIATLVAAGVHPARAVAIAARSTGSAVMEEAIVASGMCLGRARGLAAMMETSGMFLADAIRSVAAGEQAGMRTAALDGVAARYEEELEVQMETFITYLAPAGKVALAAAVGGIVVALHESLFDWIA